MRIYGGDVERILGDGENWLELFFLLGIGGLAALLGLNMDPPWFWQWTFLFGNYWSILHINGYAYIVEQNRVACLNIMDEQNCYITGSYHSQVTDPILH